MFAAARALSPSMVFIDEIDALAPAREGGAAGSGHHAGGGSAAQVTSRVVSTLLTLLDGGS